MNNEKKQNFVPLIIKNETSLSPIISSDMDSNNTVPHINSDKNQLNCSPEEEAYLAADSGNISANFNAITVSRLQVLINFCL